MTYRSLLVVLDGDPHGTDRVDVACRLANELDSHLVGLACTGVLDVPAVPAAAGAMADLLAIAWDTLRQQAAEAARQFEADCRALQVRSFESVVAEGDPALAVIRHAHCSDLTVISQARATGEGHRTEQQRVESIVLGSARPTLVLPRAPRVAAVGRRAMVAWDDSRESARALADALPLLRRAEAVHVVSWNERGAHAEGDDLPSRLEAVQRWLLWQGVTSDVAVEGTTLPVAEAMLSRALDLGADLLVMGAYGHARVMERVLGGATRGVLDAMALPVLMSH